MGNDHREKLIEDLEKINLASNPDFTKKTVMKALMMGKVSLRLEDMQGILPADTYDIIKFDAEYGQGKRRQEEMPGIPLEYMLRKFEAFGTEDYELLDDDMLSKNRKGITLVEMEKVQPDAKFIESAINAIRRDLDKGLSYHKGPQEDILKPALAALTRINVKDLPKHLMSRMEKLPDMPEAEAKKMILEMLALTGVRINVENLGRVMEPEYMENYIDFFQEDIDEDTEKRIAEEGDISPERKAEIRKEMESHHLDVTVISDGVGDFVFRRIADPDDYILFDQDELNVEAVNEMAQGAIENQIKLGKFDTSKFMESQTLQAILSHMPKLLELGGHSLQESFVPRDMTYNPADIEKVAESRQVGNKDLTKAADTLAKSKDDIEKGMTQENDIHRKDEKPNKFDEGR